MTTIEAPRTDEIARAVEAVRRVTEAIRQLAAERTSTTREP